MAASPSHSPPAKCMNISKYHIDEYQYSLTAIKLTRNIETTRKVRVLKSFLRSITVIKAYF